MKMEKVLSAVLAAAMALSFASVAVSAASVSDPTGGIGFTDSGSKAYVFDEDDEDVTSDFTLTDGGSSSSAVYANQAYFGKTYYFEISDNTEGIPWNELTNSSNFTFKLDRDKNGTYLESVKLSTKSIRGSRRAYIAIKLKSSNVIEEKQVTFDVYFKARRSPPSGSSGAWSNGDLYNARFELWATNDEEDGNDANIGTGEGVVFNPVSNEENTITWGDDEDIASLEFTASSDADKFYAKLSTKVNNTIYTQYGDPADADLYFRSFSGSSVDSTSRAKLTLYNPWNQYNDDDRNYVDPYDVYIYRVDGDYMEDITDQFAYVKEDDTPSGTDGWQTRVRTLGAYVISDRQLDVDARPNYDDDDGDDDVVVEKPTTPSRPLEPPAATGSADFVALAVTLSLLAASTVVTFQKSRKKQ